MREIKIIEHTADAAAKLIGDSFEEILLAGIDAVKRIAAPDFDEKNEEAFIEFFARIESFDQSSLVVDFLSEIIYVLNAKKALICRASFLELKEAKLKAKLYGVEFSDFKTEIKGVSYYGAELKKKNGLFEIEVIFDV